MGRNLFLMTVFFLFSSALIADDAIALSRKYELAEKLYLQEDYRSSAYECERLIREYGGSELKNEMSCLAGFCYLKLKDFARAKKYFEYVIANSNDPMLTSEAQAGLVHASQKTDISAKQPSFFSIQVGSFRLKRNAERLYNRFKRRKYTVRMIEEKEGSVTVYKVKLGKFKTKHAAGDFAKKMRKIGYQTTIVAY